jgi:hypothetical protein
MRFGADYIQPRGSPRLAPAPRSLVVAGVAWSASFFKAVPSQGAGARLLDALEAREVSQRW